jgi:hypothetical protein
MVEDPWGHKARQTAHRLGRVDQEGEKLPPKQYPYLTQLLARKPAKVVAVAHARPHMSHANAKTLLNSISLAYCGEAADAPFTFVT